MKIYLAGPLFSTAEQEFNSRLKQHLIEYGHGVWLPQDESDEQTGEKAATEIFSKDVEGIDWADVVVANMNGPDPDSGTCWECGYAYRKKPVGIFRTDFRIEGGIAPYNADGIRHQNYNRPTFLKLRRRGAADQPCSA